MIRIKICCINSIAEAKMAIDFGAAAVGLVGKMPSGPGPSEDELIASIIKNCSATGSNIFTYKRNKSAFFKAAGY